MQGCQHCYIGCSHSRLGVWQIKVRLSIITAIRIACSKSSVLRSSPVMRMLPSPIRSTSRYRSTRSSRSRQTVCLIPAACVSFCRCWPSLRKARWFLLLAVIGAIDPETGVNHPAIGQHSIERAQRFCCSDMAKTLLQAG